MLRRLTCLVVPLLVIWSAAALGEDPVRVAAIFAKTGIAATNNLPHVRAVELAAEKINREGGVLSRPLELIFIDNKSSPIGASLAARKAVEMNVTAVVGAAWSSHSLQMAPVLQAAGVPMITGSATNPKVTRLGNYIFRACFIDSFQAKAMAQFAYKELGSRTAAVLEIVNEEFSLTLAELFEASFSTLGGEIVLKGSYQNDAVDFADLLGRVAALKPDVVYAPGYGRDCGLLIKQAVSKGIQSTFLGGDGWGGALIYPYGGEALAGSFHSAHWHYDVRFPESVALQKAYREKYTGKIPHMNAPLNYDAVLILAEAIERAGSTDRVKIRDALAETSGFQGATGTITFDANGDPVDKPVVIMKLGREAPEYYMSIQP
jgi:branched-chain amino acid transport system substrate-binding protein